MASSQCCRLLVAGTPQLRHWYYNMFVLAPGIGHDIPSRQDRSQRYTSTAQCKRLMHTHAFAGKEVHQALDIPKSGIFTGKLTRVQKTLKDTPKCPNFDRFGMDFEFFLLDFWLLLCGFNSLINQKFHPTLGQYVCIYVYLCEYLCAHAHNHCHNCKMCFPHHWPTASGHPVLVLTLREPRYFS